MSRPKSFFVKRGQRLGRGVVLDPEISLTLSRKGQPLKKPLRGARLRCDCGAVYETALGSLKQGSVRSCGCLRLEASTARILSADVQEKSRRAATSHGMSASRRADYNRWRAMIRRCEDPASSGWANYGGRGIEVCDRWHDVRLFIEDIDCLLGLRPPGYTLDRKNTDGNYEPGNVQWASWGRQTRNQRRWQGGGAIYLPRRNVWVAKVQIGTYASADQAQEAYLRSVAALSEAGILE